MMDALRWNAADRVRARRGAGRAWNEVPASTVATIRQGDDDLHPFTPNSGW